MSSERGKRIGLLLPSSNTTQEPEFYRALPEGFTLHTTRLKLTHVEADSTLRIAQEIETEAKKLADADVDVVVLAATAPSSRKGLGYDQELIKTISAASGKPATTASTALLNALKALKIRRLVIAAPWSEAVNQTVASFIQANGFEVLTHKAMGHVANLEIGLLPAQTAYDLGRAVDRPDADAIMLACGNWKTFPVIDRLERDLGKPVFATNQVSLWAVLKLLGGVSSLPGCGMLLRDHLAAKASA